MSNLKFLMKTYLTINQANYLYLLLKKLLLAEFHGLVITFINVRDKNLFTGVHRQSQRKSISRQIEVVITQTHYICTRVRKQYKQKNDIKLCSIKYKFMYLL